MIHESSDCKMLFRIYQIFDCENPLRQSKYQIIITHDFKSEQKSIHEIHVVLNGTTLVMHNNYLILGPRKMKHKKQRLDFDWVQ